MNDRDCVITGDLSEDFCNMKISKQLDIKFVESKICDGHYFESL